MNHAYMMIRLTGVSKCIYYYIMGAHMTIRCIGTSKCLYYYIMGAYMIWDIYKCVCLYTVVMPSIGIYVLISNLLLGILQWMC